MEKASIWFSALWTKSCNPNTLSHFVHGNGTGLMGQNVTASYLTSVLTWEIQEIQLRIPEIGELPVKASSICREECPEMSLQVELWASTDNEKWNTRILNGQCVSYLICKRLEPTWLWLVNAGMLRVIGMSQETLLGEIFQLYNCDTHASILSEPMSTRTSII